jgi:predicted RNA binding protein YcfA (HicA-like mRNA interferase family)
MTSRLPALKPVELIKALGRVGWRQHRQTGSHIILVKEGAERPIPIPRHNKALKSSLRDEIIKQAGLTHGEFQKLL